MLSAMSFSQIVVTQELIIPYFIDQVVGDATEVSNVEVNGLDLPMLNVQAGTFTDATQSIGMGAGIILGTRGVTLAEQPNIGGGSSMSGAMQNYSDPDLESISSFSVFDQIVLDFDFVAIGDTVYMNYIFASEEYEEYVCGTVNDVVGIFITGPNPEGGVYDNENIALIPDPASPNLFTSTPVTINTLNPGVPGSNGTSSNCDDADPEWSTYSVFYQPNTTNTYEYDGRTVQLPVRWSVVPGETYHMKMGTGDGGDTAFDSAFFLKAQSFRTTALLPNSIEELDEDSFSLFPNPVEDFLTISALKEHVDIKWITIFNLQGKVLKLEKWSINRNSIDVSDLDSGIYLLSIMTQGAKVWNQRFTVR